jgi:hypothetical protein
VQQKSYTVGRLRAKKILCVAWVSCLDVNYCIAAYALQRVKWCWFTLLNEVKKLRTKVNLFRGFIVIFLSRAALQNKYHCTNIVRSSTEMGYFCTNPK